MKSNDATRYLVIRRDGRWTDVLRLSPKQPVVIGRASKSQIAIRNSQASRAHAQLSFEDGDWILRDLGSRNGTLVNEQRIQGPYRLREDDVILIAGCQMTFVQRVDQGVALDARQAGRVRSPDSDATQQQIDPSLITERRRESILLDPRQSAGHVQPALGDSHASLFRVAFELARSQSPEQAAQTALAALNRVTGTASGAVLVWPKAKRPNAAGPNTAGPNSTGAAPSVNAPEETNPADTQADSQAQPSRVAADLVPLATTSREEHSYRRISERLVKTVLDSGEAILARNIQDDLTLGTPDSQGQWTTSSALCVPIRVEQKTIGLLHIYSTPEEGDLEPDHLEYGLAIAANLAIALEHLWRTRRLTRHLQRSEQQLAALRRQLGDAAQIVGESPAILEIERQVTRAAPTTATVLVRGESGVGKELIAAAIHYASPRSSGPFVCLNCAALSPSLLESELFGHEKGAFTGATERKIGKFEAADAGTLMLDEIGEMSPEIQAKFLRVLEGQAFERVGGNTPIRVDVRVVAATNRDLEEAVRAGDFRSDLYFRLHVLELRVPPLRERGSDILLLAEHFIDRYCQEIGRRLDGLTDAARKKLLAYRWPGNIRELKNTIERAVVLCPGPQIEDSDLLLSDLQLPHTAATSHTATTSTTGTNSASTNSVESNDAALPTAVCDPSGVPLALSELERHHIDRVLRYTDGNKSQAARLLGIERSTLDRKLKRLSND